MPFFWIIICRNFRKVIKEESILKEIMEALLYP